MSHHNHKAEDVYAPLITPLLTLLRWQGEPHHLAQLIQDEWPIRDMQHFRNVMVHLGFKTTLVREPLAYLDAKYFPLLVIDDNQRPHLLQKPLAAGSTSHRPLVMIFQVIADEKNVTETADIFHKIKRFAPLLAQITLFSLVIGVMALAPTFYNMSVYDHVITSGSIKSLPALAIGVMLALVAELVLRHIRNRRLSYFGARMDHFISYAVFERLLYLPPLYSERASVSAQLARLRNFEAVREFFTGPLASLFFELPLVVFYTVVMAIIGTTLAWTPMALIGAYALLLWGMKGKLRDTARNAAELSAQRQEFLLETLTKLRAIRLNGMEKIWAEKYRRLSGAYAIAGFNSLHMAQVVEVTSYVLMTLGAIMTLTLGVEKVIEREMTVGALIASMMLIWRIVAPLQMCCASITRIQQLNSSTKQVLRLLGVTPEHNPYQPVPRLNLKGQITFSRVSMRYLPEAEPALLGVSFDVKPGQIIAVRGNNGSGKSSILKLILGLYQPQGGAVRLDGFDFRQFDPVALRQSIAYIPQHMELLPGTIRDNLHFSDPAASDEDCRDALQEACALDEVERLEHGLDTMIAGDNAEAISFMLKQRLNIARAYLKPAAIMLFDEASHSLGKDNDEAFARMIDNFRGKRTIMMVTHREDHLRLADQVFVLEKGELTHIGQPEQIITMLRGKKS